MIVFPTKKGSGAPLPFEFPEMADAYSAASTNGSTET